MSDREQSNGGEYFSERTRLEQEHDRLFDTFGSEGRKIDEGTDTSAEQLDRYLLAATEFYRLKTHELGYHGSLEESREWFSKFQNALNGTYQQEKASFALEEAQHNRDEANEMGEDTKAKYHRYAANWLRTAANCLEKQDQQPLTVQPSNHT